MNRYELAKERYAALGVDTEQAIEQLAKVRISMHCWQGDGVRGFENAGALTGGMAYEALSNAGTSGWVWTSTPPISRIPLPRAAR